MIQASMKVVYCRFQIEIVHNNPNSPDAYEQNEHRHLLHVKVSVNALDADPDELNPLRLRRLCLDQFDLRDGSIFNALTYQAIDLADWLATALFALFGNRGVRVDISEDGENGAVVSYGADLVLENK